MYLVKQIPNWRIHRKVKHLHSSGGTLRTLGRIVLDVAPSAEIYLEDNLIFGENLRRGSRAETYLKMQKDSVLRVNGAFKVFFGASLEIFPGGQLTLGRGYMNTGAAIACACSVTLGDGVFIARNVYITDSDHHRLLDGEGNIANPPAPIVIGNHVLIGYGSVILKGVRIGDGAVIGAGSVVTADVPEGCMAAGNPARVIKRGIRWQ